MIFHDWHILQSEMSQFVKEFAKAADIGRSKSSSLNQLEWAMAILIGGIVALLWAHAPVWLLVVFTIFLGLIVVAFVVGFLYFMFNRPHSLRSETFDYKMSALLISQRVNEIDAGEYDEISTVDALERRVSQRQADPRDEQ
jgi:predicted membrane channel-forming protein YqfA (hemolysin III family)